MAQVLSLGEIKMVLEPIIQKNITEIVTERIEASILDGTYMNDSKLPPEEQLATQLGVGRRAVREALKILQAKGLIRIQMGIGAIVQRNDLDSFLNALTQNVRSYLSINRADLAHVMNLRKILEEAAVDEFLKRNNPTVLNELAAIVDKQKMAYDRENYADYQHWHFEFHSSIVDVLDNPVISMIYRQMLLLIRSPMEKTGSQPEVSSRAINDHLHMVEALKNGSFSDFREVQEQHLNNSIEDLSTYGV